MWKETPFQASLSSNTYI